VNAFRTPFVAPGSGTAVYPDQRVFQKVDPAFLNVAFSGAALSRWSEMMAKSGKIEDAASAALSAIEEALDLNAPLEPTENSKKKPPESAEATVVDSRAKDEAKGPAVNPPTPRPSPSPSLITPTLAPANDDRRTIGELRQALQVPPNGTITAATVISILLWAAAWSLYVFLHRDEILDTSGALLAPRPLLTLSALVGPVAFLFITGLMARRAHEMRHIANSMTEVAIHLIEPETIATEQVVSLSQAIRREAASMGDGIERALSRASELEVIVRTEVSNLERSYSENERRIRILIDELTREREAILVNANSARASLLGARDTLSQELASTSAHLAEAVSAAGARVTSSLGSRSEEIRLALEKAGDGFDVTLSSHGARMIDTLTRTGDEVTEKIAGASDTLSRKLGDGLDEASRKLTLSGETLISDFAARGSSVIEKFEAVGSTFNDSIGAQAESALAAFEGAESRLVALMEDAETRAREEIDERSRALQAALSHSLSESAAALSEQVDSMQQRFFAVASDAVSAIGVHGDRLNETLADRLHYFEQVAVVRGGEIAERFGLQGETLEKTLAEKLSAFEEVVTRTSAEAATRIAEQGDRVTAALAGEIEVFENNILRRSEETLSRVAEGGEATSTALRESLAAIESAVRQSEETAADIGARSQYAYESLSQRLNDFEEAMARRSEEALARGEQTTATLTESVTLFAETVAQSGEDATARLLRRGEDLVAAFDRGVSDFEERITDKASAVGQRLADHTAATDATLAARLGEFEDSIKQHGDNVAAVVSDHARRVDALVEERMYALENAGLSVAQVMESTRETALAELAAQGSALGANLRETVDAVATAIHENADALTSRFTATASDAVLALATQSERLSEMLGERLATLESSLLQQGGEVAASLAEQGAKVTSTLGDQLSQFETALARDGGAIAERISESTSQLIAKVGEQISGVENVIGGQGGALVDTLRAQTDYFAAQIGDNSKHFAKDIDERLSLIDGSIGDRSAKLIETLDRIGAIQEALDARISDVQATLDGRGVDLTRDLAAVGELVAQAIESRGAAIVRQLAEKREEVVQAFEGSQDAVAHAIDTGARASMDALSEMNERIRAELPALLDRLGETNETLGAMLSATGGDLVGIERDLSERLGEFRIALNEVAGHVRELSVASSETMQGAQEFIETVETRQASLADSARRLVESQQALDAAFDGRSTSLAHLLAAMDEKHAEFERSMSGFAANMTAALQEIEARTDDIGGSLAQTAVGTVNLIEERFSALRETAETERAQTARTLTAALTDAYQQMNSLFDEAQTKFKSSAAEIRGLSQAIHGEIEETREALRRSATELPQETAEQAQALRRVVGDQVKALNELTNIVARSGRAFDVSEPAPEAQRSFQPAGPRPEPARQPPARQEIAARKDPASPPPPVQAPPAPPQPPQGGWLSDLLDRATRDDGDAETGNAPLDGLSLEIARMVNREAVSDLWRRYQLGEKGPALFSPRLYTAQGRQTFGEISRRYMSEPAFHETIDQYIRSFEELVVETTRDDRDGSRTLDLLTGDSGKVYTMLAHATGRLS
jgi:hypothetical protein